MLYPTVRQFKRILLSRPLNEILDKHVLAGTPYAFREYPERFEVLRRFLARALKVPQENILVVGSGRIGFSLSPDNFPRQFSDASDIDVLVHDQFLFDEIWTILLKWHYPNRYGGLYGVDRHWAAERKKEVYWGWLQPERIEFPDLSLPRTLQPLRDICTTWFNAFRGLSLEPGFSGRNVSGRLYRTLKHASLYHLDGLRQIKQSLG